MKTQQYHPIKTLCEIYKVDKVLFNSIADTGLIEIESVNGLFCVHQENLGQLELIFRLHFDLDINIQGIDVVINLIQRVEELKMELVETKNKLGLYES